jgi:AAA domain
MNDDGAPFVTKRYTPATSSNQVEAGVKLPPVPSPNGEGGKSDRAGEKSVRFPLVAFDDVQMSTTGFYLIKNLIPRAGLVIVWGAPKCGKSFWIFDMLMHVACGWEYRGLRVKTGPVVYCALEGVSGFKNRIGAFRDKHPGSKGAKLSLMFTPLDLMRDHKALIVSIRAQLPEGRQPFAVAIDTLNRSLVGSESSDEDMAAYVRAADAIRVAFDCVVIIVHHCGHHGDRPRGHSSLLGADDVLIAVKRDAAENIVATIENAKDAATGLEIVSRLVVVDVGKDEDGDPVTSCVIEPVGEPAVKAAPKDAPKGTAKSEIEILKTAMLEAYDRLADSVPTRLGLNGASVRKVSVERLRDELKTRGLLEVDDAGAVTPPARKQFQRAKVALLAGPKPRLVEGEGLVWR